MTGMAVAGLVMAGVATAIGGYTAYKNSQAQAEATKAQAEAQIDANNQQAAQVQAQAEQDAQRRSRQLAQDIGNSYAQYAGNGLAVDGGSTDTLGQIIGTQKREGQADISTIQQNAKMNIWSITKSSQNVVNSANMQIKEYDRQGKLGLWQTFTGLPLTSNNGWGSATSIVASGYQPSSSTTAASSSAAAGKSSVWNTTNGFKTSNMA